MIKYWLLYPITHIFGASAESAPSQHFGLTGSVHACGSAVGHTRKGSERPHYAGSHLPGLDAVPSEPAKAARFFRFLAERGEPDAQFSLAAQHYAVGNGVARSESKASFWLGRVRIFFHRISEHADGKRRGPAPI